MTASNTTYNIILIPIGSLISMLRPYSSFSNDIGTFIVLERTTFDIRVFDIKTQTDILIDSQHFQEYEPKILVRG
mgnify:CR=1 FL=1